MVHVVKYIVFFFNDTATTEIYTLSLHDALPISPAPRTGRACGPAPPRRTVPSGVRAAAARRRAGGSARATPAGRPGRGPRRGNGRGHPWTPLTLVNRMSSFSF